MEIIVEKIQKDKKKKEQAQKHLFTKGVSNLRLNG